MGSVWGRRFRGLRSPLVLVAVVNLLLLAGFVGSRGGQTIRVRVEAHGNEFSAFVQDKLRATAQYNTALGQRMVISLDNPDEIPSLPRPRGIDRLEVTDLSSGRTLLEEDFDRLPDAREMRLDGDFTISDGVLTSNRNGSLVIDGIDSTQVAVEVVLRNVTGASITLRKPDNGPGVTYFFRPFRNLDSGFVQNGVPDSLQGGARMEAPAGQTTRSILAMALAPFPAISLGLGLFLLASAGRRVGSLDSRAFKREAGRLVLGAWLLLSAVILVVLGGWQTPLAFATDGLYLISFAMSLGVLAAGYAIQRRLGRRIDVWPPALASMALFALIATLYLNYALGSHMPHVPDSVSYIFQAKIFAAGHLRAPAPPVEEAFDFFYPPMIAIDQGHWFSIFPFGHSLMLAIGEAFGVVWLVPPLLGAISIVLIGAIGRSTYNARTGLLAAAMMAVSPFFLMTSSNFMSHGTAAFFLLACLWCLGRWDKRPLVYPGLAGVFFGLLFNTRPLSAVALIAPFGLYLVYLTLAARGFTWRSVAAFCAGGLLMFGVYMLYNLGTTGDPLVSGYVLTDQNNIGFSNGHTLGLGVQYEQIQTALLILVIDGWPVAIGLALVFIPFVTGTRRAWSWFLLASAGSMMAAYTLYSFHGVMYGPRFWYEAFPLLILLSAHGADVAARGISGLVDRAGGRRWFPRAGEVLVLSLLVALMATSVYGWLLSERQPWRIEGVPATASELRGFNGINDGLVKLIDDSDLEHSLVLTEACLNWQCAGNVFWLNDPWLSGNVIYGRDLDNRRSELLAAFPDRSIYHASYGRPALTLLSQGTAESNSAPPTPQVEGSDGERRSDLARLAAALEDYHSQFGVYPSTNGDLQSACIYRELDVLCRFEPELGAGTFVDPRPEVGKYGYWYVSDGETYILLASLEGKVEAGEACRPQIEALKDVPNLVCITPGR